MPRWLCPLLPATLLLPLLCSGCAKETVAAKPEAPKVTVQHPEERTLVDYDEYNGWTDASARVEVRSRVRGHIQKVDFVDGQFVEKDALLFELDPRPFQSEIDRAKERVKIAQAQQEAAFKEETRQKELKAQSAARQTDVDKAEAARKVFDAEILSAQEEVRRTELELDYAKVTAPIAGRISRAMLTAGNLVNAGGSDPLLTTIVAIDPIWVYFAVDERALLEYRANHPATMRTEGSAHPLKESQVPFEFRLETDSTFAHKGVLDFSENSIDSTTGTIEVRGAAPNADGAFLPGSRVRVRVPVRDSYTALVVPDEAISSDQDKKFLLCLNAENVVVRRDVRLGKLLEDGMRVILPSGKEGEGLTAADRVIVEGIQRARINYPVQPMDANGEPIGSPQPKADEPAPAAAQ
jgi:RND family efflux transporter MFP subunit